MFRTCQHRMTDRQDDTVTEEKAEQKKRQSSTSPHTMFLLLVGWGWTSGRPSDPNISIHNPFIMPLNNPLIFFKTSQKLLVSFFSEQTWSKANYLQAQCQTPPVIFPWREGAVSLGENNEWDPQRAWSLHSFKPATSHPAPCAVNGDVIWCDRRITLGQSPLWMKRQRKKSYKNQSPKTYNVCQSHLLSAVRQVSVFTH